MSEAARSRSESVDDCENAGPKPGRAETGEQEPGAASQAARPLAAYDLSGRIDTSPLMLEPSASPSETHIATRRRSLAIVVDAGEAEIVDTC